MELLESVIHGGWHEAYGVPTCINLLVKPGSAIKMYKQIPEYATPWLTADDLSSGEPDSLFDDLLAFYREVFDWKKTHFVENAHGGTYVADWTRAVRILQQMIVCVGRFVTIAYFCCSS